jgi:hypothetical protein
MGVLRKADGARLRNALKPRGDVDAVAHKVAVALLDDVAQMDANAKLDTALGRHAGIALDHALNGAGLDQLLAALEVALGELERALPCADLSLCGRKRVVGLLHVGFCGAQLRLVLRRSDDGDTCPFLTSEPSPSVTSESLP